MSYMKNAHTNYIALMSGIESNNIDDLYGTVLTVEEKTVLVDDFIINSDDNVTNICTLITDADGRETYAIFDVKQFAYIARKIDDEKIVLPVFDYIEA